MRRNFHNIIGLPTLRIAVIMAMCFLPAMMKAQVDAQLTQYWAVPTYYNPGAVGTSDSIRITAASRIQWVGIPKAPQSFIGLADSPFKVFGKRVGAGVAIMQESAGLYSTLNASLQMAYKIKLFKGVLSIGLQFGLINQTFKGTDVYIPDDDNYHESSDDGIPTTDLTGTAFDMSAGLFYTHKWFWASISSTHLMQPTVTLQSDSETSTENRYEFQTGRACYFMAGSNIPIKNTLFEIQPSVMAKTDFTFFSAEATARVRYNKFLSGGIGYRWNDAISVMIGAEYKSFFLGYSYDYPISNISKGSSGSHEVFLRYNVKLDLSDKNKNKHKSIRIM